MPFETVNRVLTKKEIGDVIEIVYRDNGQKETVLFPTRSCTRLPPRFGADISSGKDDMVIPSAKRTWSRRRGSSSRTTSNIPGRDHHRAGKVDKVIDAWSRCGDGSRAR